MSDELTQKLGSAPDHQKVAGLDTLRFLCALWVLMGHGATPPLTATLNRQTDWGRLIDEVYGLMISGPAAVIVFFVISGFCIHLPHRKDGIRSLKEYFIRRYVRILLPLGAALVLIAGVNLGENPLNAIPIWSLIAEVIYYTVYPLLLKLSRVASWWGLFAIAFAGASVLVFQGGLKTVQYPSFGHLGNSLLGLPCWILGVIIAQGHDRNLGRSITAGQIWLLRAIIVALGGLTHILAYREIIGQPFTLTLFALAAWFWVTREIRFFARNQAIRWLEWAGSWSYSLYLLHMFLLDNISLLPFANPWGYLAWFTKFTLALLLSWLFARAFELPAHRLARQWGARCRRPVNPKPQAP